MIYARLSGYYYLQKTDKIYNVDIKNDLKMIDMDEFNSSENLYEIFIRNTTAEALFWKKIC
jgi:hypothetical protein